MAAAIRVPVASPGDHVAHFYHDDGELAGQAGSYLLEAYDLGRRHPFALFCGYPAA